MRSALTLGLSADSTVAPATAAPIRRAVISTSGSSGIAAGYSWLLRLVASRRRTESFGGLQTSPYRGVRRLIAMSNLLAIFGTGSDHGADAVNLDALAATGPTA